MAESHRRSSYGWGESIQKTVYVFLEEKETYVEKIEEKETYVENTEEERYVEKKEEEVNLNKDYHLLEEIPEVKMGSDAFLQEGSH